MRQKIYDFIVAYITEYGYSPNFLEIAEGVGLKSIQSVNYHLQKMLDMGMVETDHPACLRAIRVSGHEFVRKANKDLHLDKSHFITRRKIWEQLQLRNDSLKKWNMR